MAKLNQIVAVEKDVKKSVYADLTAAHHLLQQNKLLFGLSRTYQPFAEDGTKYPSESAVVQVRTKEIVEQTSKLLVKLFDVTATKDWANCQAKADVVVDGRVLVSGAPVTYLLFLEKQLTDIHTFVKKLPLLDPSETWVWDEATNSFKTPQHQTIKTSKKPFAFVKAPATKEHPAQVDVLHQDIAEGTWTEVKFSGAFPAQLVKELLDRVEKLQMAVKFAREEANSLDVSNVSIGKSVFNYLFGEIRLES